MSRSARFFVWILAAASLAPASRLRAQAFEGSVTYEMQLEGESMRMRMTHHIKGSSVRVEMGMEGRTMTLLTDRQGERKIVLIPETKQWMDMAAMEARVNAMGMGGRGAPEQQQPGAVELRTTGRTEVVAGHECEHVVIVSGGTEVDICAAKGLGWYNGSPPSMGPMGPGGGMGAGGMGMGMGGMGAEQSSGLTPAQFEMVRERFADGFFPLKISGSDRGKAFTMEVVTLEQRTLEDALFSPPADYREVRFPGGVR